MNATINLSLKTHGSLLACAERAQLYDKPELPACVLGCPRWQKKWIANRVLTTSLGFFKKSLFDSLSKSLRAAKEKRAHKDTERLLCFSLGCLKLKFLLKATSKWQSLCWLFWSAKVINNFNNAIQK